MNVTDLEVEKQLLDQMRQDSSKLTSTGFQSLDALMGGLIKGGLTLIGSRPAMGGTALALNIASNLSQQQSGTILVISRYTNDRDMASRLLTIGLKIEPKQLLDGKMSAYEREWRCSDFFYSQKGNIKIEWDSFLSLNDIQNFCDRVPDLKLLIIDDLEYICEPIDFFAEPVCWKPPHESMDKIVRFLKNLASTYGIPVIGTVRVSRNVNRRKNKRPKLSDLKKCGASDDAVDQVIFPYRHRYYCVNTTEMAEIIVAKNNRGKTGMVELGWNWLTGRLDEITDESQREKYGRRMIDA
jgi:replicative DNA helicase